jgi:hypothetical protein
MQQLQFYNDNKYWNKKYIFYMWLYANGLMNLVFAWNNKLNEYIYILHAPIKKWITILFFTCDHNNFAHDHEQNVTTNLFFTCTRVQAW